MQINYQWYLCRFHSALLAAERPAEKDWPFLLNLGRNFFSQQRQKCLDTIRRGGRKRQRRIEQGEREGTEEERKMGRDQRDSDKEIKLDSLQRERESKTAKRKKNTPP